MAMFSRHGGNQRSRLMLSRAPLLAAKPRLQDIFLFEPIPQSTLKVFQIAWQEPIGRRRGGGIQMVLGNHVQHGTMLGCSLSMAR